MINSNLSVTLTREIQSLIDREDRQAYRSGKLADHVVESVRQLFLQRIPAGDTLDIHDVMDELLMSWGERFRPFAGHRSGAGDYRAASL